VHHALSRCAQNDSLRRIGVQKKLSRPARVIREHALGRVALKCLKNGCKVPVCAHADRETRFRISLGAGELLPNADARAAFAREVLD